uniref:Uncharacterized protein n=1 Tax=Anguilla anguilla TaxID=7936 RepID=A0A0E9VK42_ANGAN
MKLLHCAALSVGFLPYRPTWRKTERFPDFCLAPSTPGSAQTTGKPRANLWTYRRKNSGSVAGKIQNQTTTKDKRTALSATLMANGMMSDVKQPILLFVRFKGKGKFI